MMSETPSDRRALLGMGALVTPEQACRCDQIGFCTRPGDGDEGRDLCRYCMTRIDPVYSPCPQLGFGDD